MASFQQFKEKWAVEIWIELNLELPVWLKMNLGLENYVKYNFPKGKKVFMCPVWLRHLSIETGTSEKDRLCYSRDLSAVMQQSFYLQIL